MSGRGTYGVLVQEEDVVGLPGSGPERWLRPGWPDVRWTTNPDEAERMPLWIACGRARRIRDGECGVDAIPRRTRRILAARFAPTRAL